MNSFQAECLKDFFFSKGKVGKNIDLSYAIALVSIPCVYGIVINICLFIFNSLLRRVKKRIPDIPLPSDTIQLLLKDPAKLHKALTLSLTSKQMLEISWHQFKIVKEKKKIYFHLKSYS